MYGKAYLYFIKQTVLKPKIMTTLDSKINNLKPGQELQLSESNGIKCHVERTGNGKLLKYVRTFADGSFEVFNTVRFNS